MLRWPWLRGEARCGRRRQAGAVLAIATATATAYPVAAQAPPPAVVVAPVKVETVARSEEFVGRVQAIQSVDLVSRVEGFLETLNFKEGSAVKAGDLLIEIEKAPYEAQLASANGQVAAANAQVSSAAAQLKNADVVLQRQVVLLRRGTVSQATQDDAQAQRDVAAAAVEQAQAMVQQGEAQVQTAQLNLGYTDIKAPISGQIGAVAITAGNLVSAQSGTIATIVQLDPIRVAFSIPETLFVGLSRQRNVSAEEAAARDLFTPQLTLPNGTPYGRDGTISFASNEISAATGTLVIYAEFPNPDGLLLPGIGPKSDTAYHARRRCGYCQGHLDIAFHPGSATGRFANDAAGIGKLLSLLAKEKAERVVFEPTNHFHRPLQEALAAAGVPFVKVNPTRARRFAEATGTLAKTDRIDARVLARMGAALDLAPTVLPSPSRQRLKELVGTRRAFVDDVTAARNRLGSLTHPACRRRVLQQIRLLQRHVGELEKEIEAALAADPELSRACALLETIPGIGRLTAAILIAEMPELGTTEARQAASLAGLAPVAADSGARRARRAIRGGRGALRQALYMPALCAVRHNSAMQAFYERLRAAGKPGKLALTAVMRKLLITANAILRDGRAWRENPA